MGNSKRINIATLERAQHVDLMRGDAFATATVLEIMRGLYDDQRWPMQFPGSVARASALETPLRAHVLSGLLVRPDNNTYLTVDAGAMLAAIPAGSDDDSILELVNDPGVNDAGSLLFVANAAGSVRLDIVEVSVVDTNIETATVGIFNAGTRSFDPTSSPKVKAPRLTYRIRQGVAGAGLPAMANGWLPLAVICHQPSTVSFASCDLWDVRPLIADLVQFGSPQLDPAGAASKFEFPVNGRWRALADSVKGFALGQFNGYVAGGQLISSTAFPIADHGNSINSFATNYSANKDPAFAFTANTIVHVAACFPGGLPRWVKYVDTGTYGIGGKRVPVGPRGILVLTNDQPKCNGYYAGVTLPTTCGFTADAPGVALVSAMVDGPGTRAPGTCNGRSVTLNYSSAVLPGIAGVASNQVSWTFSPNAGVVIPAHAKTIDVQFNITSAGGDGTFEVYVKNQNGDGEVLFTTVFTVVTQSNAAKFTIRGIPLATDAPWDADGGGTPAQTYLRLNSVAACSAAAAFIVGYSL